MYKFEEIIPELRDEPELLNAIVHIGIGLPEVVYYDSYPDLLRAALRDPSCEDHAITTLLALFRDDMDLAQQVRMRLDIMEQFVAEDAGSQRLSDLAHILCEAALRKASNSHVQPQPPAELDRVNEFVYSLIANTTDSRLGKGYIIGQLQRSLNDQPGTHDLRVRLLDLTMAVAEAEHRAGLFSPNYHWSRYVLESLVVGLDDTEAVRRLMSSPVSQGIDMAKIVSHVLGEDGELAFDYIRSSGYDYETIDMVLDCWLGEPFASRNLPRRRAACARILMDPEATRLACIQVLCALTQSGVEATRPYTDYIVHVINLPFDDLSANEADQLALLIDRLRQQMEPVFMPAIFRNALTYASGMGYPEHAVKDGFAYSMYSVMNSYPERVTREVAEDMWAAVDGFVSEKAPHVADDLRLLLITSGLLSETTLTTIANEGTNLSAFAATALAESNPDRVAEDAPPVLNGDGFPVTVMQHTTFKEYLGMCKSGGLPPLHAMGMYTIDTRIPLEYRRDARVHLVMVLSHMPHRAAEVPEPVWVGFNRNRDPLPVSLELAQTLQNLGPAANRFGSRNLVKTAFKF